MKNSVLSMLALLVALAAAPANAAGTGAVQGTVVDVNGAPISGAAIVLVSQPHVYRSSSDAHGAFSIQDVAPGSYDLIASANRYRTLSNRIVGVSGGQTAVVDVVLAGVDVSAMTALGTVSVNGRQALSTASAPSVDLDPQDLAGQGIENLGDILAEQIALTMTRPAGGAPGLPESAALRGPDPSETVIDVDGHQVNNSNSGDFDLSLLDPSEFQNVQVVYGIGPSSLVGANTQGGAINFRTIDPTPQQQGLLRFSAGSFNTFGETLQTTGTDQRLGYALSYHRYTTSGEVNNYPVTDDKTGLVDIIGSNIAATTTLAKLRYALGIGDGFIEATYRNTTAFRNLSAPLATPDVPTVTNPLAFFSVMPDASSANISPSLGLDVQVPLGAHDSSGQTPATLIARHEDTLNSQSVPSDVETLGNPYLFNARDHIFDDSATYQRSLDNGTLTFGYDVRRETLTAAAPLAPGPPSQSQTGRSWVGRYEWRATPKLNFTVGTYVSSFDTFGRSLDPRLAAVWTPTADSVVRASIGTAFRAPLLAERVFNPSLTAERTTEYELGYERRLGDGPLAAHGVLNVYRTNLRDPIFFTTDAGGALLFLKNLGDVVYQGVELRIDKPLTEKVTLSGAYGVSIAYPINNPFAFDPAAPNVVAGEQFQGIPPHKAQLSLIGRASNGFGYFVDGAYESSNNELNRPAYATLGAGVTKSMGRMQITLAGRNLTNQYDDLFTLPNAGTPYPTPTGLSPTNAYSLQGRGVTLTLTQKY
ncbi:MAG TPA: TonB-dependent receptor [Candidatus Eremiobacteraceae bacterium]|nr:TonB-dependent receptor [Candidatus Eremiobacteraceae bacterium]